MSKPNTMRYVVRFGDCDEITLEVDTSVLTEQLATEINTFWSGATDRLQAESGDVVRAVVRLFGACVVKFMHCDGWADVYENQNDLRAMLLRDVLREQYEGWPDAQGLGISIVSALVQTPSFDSVGLEVLA
jgi:hypothetical protein